MIPTEKRRTWAEIDLDSAAHNFHQVQAGTRAKICCVVKADAYGHGDVWLSRLYEQLGADYLAVATLEEALHLRRGGIRLPILVLGYADPACAPLLAENGITQTVFSYDYGMALAAAAEAAGVTVKVHLKLDTGMGRIGFLCRPEGAHELEQAAAVCRHPRLDAEGVFMHFAVADEGEAGKVFTEEQFAGFMQGIARLEAAGITFRLRHCANSAAIFDYPATHLDMVRAGVALYGLQPSGRLLHPPRLKPVMELCSVITHIKELAPGQSVSYGREFIADRPLRVATVPIGYADGFRRQNSRGYSLCVNGMAAPILGRVCMDQLMVDVTGVDCRVGDRVTVFGGEPPFTADALARLNDTINYEIVCDVAKRVPRAYVRDSAIIAWQDALTEV